MQLKKIYLIFTICVYGNISYSQNFEWIQTYGTKALEYTTGIVAAENGGSVFIYNYQGIGGDTVNLSSFKFIDIHKYQNYVVRLDSSGKVSNAIPVGYDGLVMLKSDGKGNYFVTGYTTGNDSVTKFDKNFKRLWSFKLSKTGLISCLSHFSEGRLYLSGLTNDSNRIVEINTSNGNVIWTKNLSKNKLKSFIDIRSVVYLKGNLYLSGKISGGLEFLLGSDTIYAFSSFVIQMDTLGNYANRFLLQCKYDVFTSGIFNLTSDKNFLYVCGHYKDTVYWGNKKIA